jgi:hypothetical protein
MTVGLQLAVSASAIAATKWDTGACCATAQTVLPMDFI